MDAPETSMPLAEGEASDPATPDYIPRGHTMASITSHISDIVLVRPSGRGFLSLFGLSSVLLVIFTAVVIYLLLTGVGIWGIDIPVCWSWSITDFVWWVGIGHAGTLISAILLLLHQKWRTSINRIAEAMTIFAIMCAGMFPLLHLGRCGSGRSFAARWCGTCLP
jgi:Ni/Fe-hydrogenase subunit HybB-like protein